MIWIIKIINGGQVEVLNPINVKTVHFKKTIQYIKLTLSEILFLLINSL